MFEIGETVYRIDGSESFRINDQWDLKFVNNNIVLFTDDVAGYEEAREERIWT